MAQDRNFLTTLVTFLPIQVVELYLAGWTYNRLYYLPFGIDQQLFEFGPYDQASKGFALCREDGYLLIALLIASTLLPILFHFECKKALYDLGRIAGVFMVLLITGWCVYCRAAHDASRDAKRDLSDKSQLVSVTFASRGVHYRGQLVGMKGDTILVSQLDKFDKDGPDKYGVAVFRAEEVTDLKIIGRQ
jgi:hypothetical protein